MKRLETAKGRIVGYVHVASLVILVSVLGIAGCSREHNPLAPQEDGRQADTYVDVYVGMCGQEEAWITVDTVTDPDRGTTCLRITVLGIHFTEPNWNPDPGAPTTPSYPEWYTSYQCLAQLESDTLWRYEDTSGAYRYSVSGIVTLSRITGQGETYAHKSDGTEEQWAHVCFQGRYEHMRTRDLPLGGLPVWPIEEENPPIDSSVPQDVNLQCVTTNGRMLVAAGNIIVTSFDGRNWFSRGGGAGFVRDVIWSGTQFLAVGWSGTILGSADGLTWTSRWNHMPRHDFNAVAFDGQRYVVLGNTFGNLLNTTVATSSDAVIWDTQQIDCGWLSDLVWTGSCFLATSSAQNAAAVSSDGEQWTRIELGYNFSDILLDSSQIVAVRYTPERTEFYRSIALSDWTLVSTLDSTCILNLAYDGTTYVAVGTGPLNSATPVIYTSTNLQQWTQRVRLDRGVFFAVLWTGTQFVAVGVGLTATSSDGESWDVNELM